MMDTDMWQKLIISSLFCGMISGTAVAQSETSIEDRVAKLEAQLAQQNATIANLQSEVQSVVKQNLALKKNLMLTPPKAVCKPTENLEYRLIEATGNKKTGDVFITVSAENNATKDAYMQYNNVILVDETGTSYQRRLNEEKVSGKLRGLKESLFYSSFDFYPNTPVMMDFVVSEFNPDANFIKHFQLEPAFSHLGVVTFDNIPIKWVDSASQISD